ncbi:hypothetical protein HA402_004148 [Bradysia odoriphaga]|nr:hypothetical protein HA402_004148 [Bradysia odoriphaga]
MKLYVAPRTKDLSLFLILIQIAPCLRNQQMRMCKMFGSSSMTKEMQIDYPMDAHSLLRMLKEKENVIDDLKLCLSRTNNDFQNLRNQFMSENRVRNIVSETEIQKMLPMLTPNQIALMTKRKNKVRWTVDEIANGFTHCYLSKRGYNFTIHNLGIPQPSVRTLHRWAENMNVSPGVLKDSLIVLDGLSKTLTEAERQVIIAFDEMACKSLYQYNKSLDLIMGPNKQMQTIMVRGLFSRFKQPIYIGFDEKMSQDLFMSVCSKLHEVNLSVVGSVCDNGGGNIGLWTNSLVDYKNVTMKHPNTGDLIFMFSDAPHLLKLLRNWFLDGGFILKDGTKLDQGLLRKLVAENPEISSIYHLSLKHLTVAGAERQNVRMASELFSHTVAEALRRRFPHDEKAKNLASFIELVNNWLDIMNSHCMNGIAYKKPYGLALFEQDSLLDEMYSTIEGMKCLNKKNKVLNSLQIFQKGILMSITSIKGLRNTAKRGS